MQEWRYQAKRLFAQDVSRCKWFVTDPPQCRANLRDHFPSPATLHIRALRRSSDERVHPREERPVMNRGPHTLLSHRDAPRCNARYMCSFRAQFWIPSRFSRARFLAPSTPIRIAGCNWWLRWKSIWCVYLSKESVLRNTCL